MSDRAQALAYLKTLFPDQFIILILGENVMVEGQIAVQTHAVTNVRDSEAVALILNTAAQDALANAPLELPFDKVN